MENQSKPFFMILWMSTYVTFSRRESFQVLRLNESPRFESFKNSFCDVQKSFAIMIESRIKIGTTYLVRFFLPRCNTTSPLIQAQIRYSYLSK